MDSLSGSPDDGMERFPSVRVVCSGELESAPNTGDERGLRSPVDFLDSQRGSFRLGAVISQ